MRIGVNPVGRRTRSAVLPGLLAAGSVFRAARLAARLAASMAALSATFFAAASCAALRTQGHSASYCELLCLQNTIRPVRTRHRSTLVPPQRRGFKLRISRGRILDLGRSLRGSTLYCFLLRTLLAALAFALLVLPERLLICRILLFPQSSREILQSKSCWWVAWA